jgi:hypothetical protein
MRVQPAVLNSALKQFNATGNDLKEAQKKIRTLGFEQIGVSGDSYRNLLGEPIFIQSLDDNEVPDVFRGSRSLHFKLPLWADFNFVVNEDLSGRAWDPGFRRSPNSSVPLANYISDLAPWRFVKTEITERFGQPRFGDAWDCWEELNYFIPPNENAPPQSYSLLFDYNLLQSFYFLEPIREFQLT